jgi:ATP-dependent helicase/nuclease subunit B
MHETKLELQFESSKYKNIFTGIIDKIMYKNVDGVDYIAVVDYKSGSQKAILDNIDTGFNLQLPIYAYFLVKSELFKNPKILGLYLQHIISNTTDKTKSLEDEKMNNLKLDGYSVMDQPALSLFDPTYKKSRYIKSMSVTKDGNFGRYTKLYTEEELNKIISLVEELITGAFEKIEAGEFTINPKVIGDDNESCKFCHYNDICYKKNSNLIKLKAKKIEEVLAGE